MPKITLETKAHPLTEEKRHRPYIMIAAEAEFKRRIKAQAARFGMSVSTYVRLATTERLERDEKVTGQP